jgi:hypothetical protein
MENAGIFYGHLEYFTVIWNSLWPFGNVVVIWFIFPRFVRLCQEKSGNPAAVKELTRQSIAFSSVVAAFQRVKARPLRPGLPDGIFSY